jgi:hypothetical protein
MADHGYDNHDQANPFNAPDKNSVCILRFSEKWCTYHKTQQKHVICPMKQKLGHRKHRETVDVQNIWHQETTCLHTHNVILSPITVYYTILNYYFYFFITCICKLFLFFITVYFLLISSRSLSIKSTLKLNVFLYGVNCVEISLLV